MPRHALLFIGLVASAASAQAPADSAVAVRDSVIVETVVRQLETRRVGTDSVRVSAGRQAPARSARLAFPTEGGVFYYRAGSGSAIRRVQRTRPDGETPSDAPSPAVADRQIEAPTQAGQRPAARPVERVAPSGVTQGDLDRLERRLMDALNRRIDRERSAGAAVIVPRAGEERTVAPPVVTNIPMPRGDSLRAVGAAELAESPDLLTDEPEVTTEIVERAILDTGLFRTSRVFFAFGKADLLPVSRSVLDTISEVLLRYPDLRIEVGGHTDAISSDAFNLALSERRAGTVAAYLIGRGIAAEQITAVGYGEARPVATNETETGRALNRRVEFVVRGEASGQ